MIRLFSLISLIIVLSGCTPTAERLKAERMVQERELIYSQQAGDLYRYPPRDYPVEESARAMPDFAVLSYSPLRPEPAIIEKRRGRMAQARPQRSPQFASGFVYSPITGEAVKLVNGKPLPRPAE